MIGIAGTNLIEFHSIPQNTAHLRREQAVNQRISGRIEWRQTLNERRNGDVRLRSRNALEHLQQIEYDIRRPADDENYCEENNDAIKYNDQNFEIFMIRAKAI